MRRLTQPDPLIQVSDFLGSSVPGPCVVQVGQGDGDARMRREVLAGLTDPAQPWVPPTYLYDQRGSELYEAITALPEYYPTRTEAALLATVARELGGILSPAEVIELGSGSSSKTRLILDAVGAGDRPMSYVPIDVSPTMLALAAKNLGERFPRLRVLGLAGQYEDGFRALPPASDRLFVFLGGTIGNFPPAAQADHFARLAAVMRPGNRLLLGFDRRDHAAKPAERIEAAYNDAEGVTAAFNLNLLAHLNTRLGGDFDLDLWQHQAIYDSASAQIAMYLTAQADQVVTLAELGRSFEFRQGARILTEVSRKFDPEELAAWFEARGFRCERRWTDERALVGLMLLERRSGR